MRKNVVKQSETFRRAYRFTSAHSAGAWDSSDVTQTTIIEEIQRGGA